jgi:hypothetical protein
MIGIVSDRPRIRRQSSRPSISGMVMSRITSPGSLCWNTFQASSPVPYCSTGYPSRRSAKATVSRMLFSSSTTATTLFAGRMRAL